MNAQRLAGIVALVSGLLLVSAVVLAGTGMPGDGATSGWPMGPAMMGNGYGGQIPMGGMGAMPGFGASGPASSPIPGAPEVRVTAGNFFFDPSEIHLPKNTNVNLTLLNPATSAVPHDLTVPALGIHIVANAGQTVTVGLRGLPSGRYDAVCSIPGHADAGMRGVVFVR